MHAAHCVIIDDDRDILVSTTQVVGHILPCLRLTGFDSAITAIEFLRTNSVDLILTDYRMPFVNGLRLIAAVRLIDRHVPVGALQDRLARKFRLGSKPRFEIRKNRLSKMSDNGSWVSPRICHATWPEGWRSRLSPLPCGARQIFHPWCRPALDLAFPAR